jgi:cytochrome c556
MNYFDRISKISNSEIVIKLKSIVNTFLLGIAAANFLAAAVFAQLSSGDAAARRTQAMEQIAGAMKRLTFAARDADRFSADQVFDDAEIMEIYSRTFSSWFQSGSAPTSNKLNPAVWANLDAVDRLSLDLADIALELQSQADTIKQAELAGFVRRLAANCKSCHRQFKLGD